MVLLSDIDYSGYGDLVPVTPLGHMVGIIFLLLSAGIMVTLLGGLLSFIASEGMPLFLLCLQKKKNWYYFADYGVESNTLAANIYKEDPNALIIFGENGAAKAKAQATPACT